jgi:hypothetical protein
VNDSSTDRSRERQTQRQSEEEIYPQGFLWSLLLQVPYHMVKRSSVEPKIIQLHRFQARIIYMVTPSGSYIFQQ